MHSVDFHAIDCTISRWLREEIMKGSWFAPLQRNVGGWRSKPFKVDACAGPGLAGWGSGSAIATVPLALVEGTDRCAGAAGAGAGLPAKLSSIETEDQLDFAGAEVAAAAGIALDVGAETPGEDATT